MTQRAAPAARCHAPGRAALAVFLACACAAVRAQPASTTAAEPTSDELARAIAGPLVVALSDQFGGRHVDMHLQALQPQLLHDGNGHIRGTGIVNVQGQPGDVGFSFRVPWNQQLQRAGFPEVSVGGAVAGERQVPNDIGLVRQLEADMAKALSRHMRQQASVRLDRIATAEASQQFLRINASGMAYFSRSGAGTILTILALYDRRRHAWMRLEYGLGEGAALVSR